MTVSAIESDTRDTATIGTRVRTDDGHFGTVMYVGPVDSTQGDWFGVVWDNAERGKHDGQYNGVRYFSAERNAGSFIRPKKVTTGFTFYERLLDRYGLQDDPDAGVSTEELFVVGDDHDQITKVDMVGAQKVNQQQSDFQKLEIVVLRDTMVRGLEDGLDLSKHVPNVIELNVSKNLLSSWEETAKITSQLRKLTNLNVSENRFTDTKKSESLKDAFATLRTLFLNKMDVSFEKVLLWSEMWQSVEELHVCFNNIPYLVAPGTRLSKVSLLNLEGNPLNHWNEVLHLSSMPVLRTLILNSTGLNVISLCGCSDGAFPCLTELSLCSNEINDWMSINELNKLKCLQDLKLIGNPLMASDKLENVREIVIAKIGTLKTLNRTEVTCSERKGAEIGYLKRFGPEWLKAGGRSDRSLSNATHEFRTNHPRYDHLINAYGAAEESEMYREAQGLKDSLVSVLLKCTHKTVKKKVPTSMTVQKLKTLVHRLFKAELASLKLVNVGDGTKDHQVELDNDLRQLSFYSILNDDIIEVTW